MSATQAGAQVQAQICIFFHTSITHRLKRFLRFSPTFCTARFPRTALTLEAALHLITVPSKASRRADRTRTTNHRGGCVCVWGGDPCLSERAGAAVGDAFMVYSFKSCAGGQVCYEGETIPFTSGGYKAKAERPP